MKKIDAFLTLKYCVLAVLAICMAFSCKRGRAALTADESALVKDSVNRLAANIAGDISKKGPRAWLDYFENAPGFFMASDGALAFKDYPSAKTFILNTLVKSISTITLNWKNERIDALSPTLASFGADFHEDLVLSGGQKLSVDGYFTATAHFDGHCWKLRNMNWAIKNQQPVK